MPHTKHILQGLLASARTHPHHHWGQNFLIDLNLMQVLVDAAHLDKSDVVLEVGSGTGSLTGLLAERAGAVITVEIDPALAGIAGRELSGYSNVSLIHADVLKSKNRIEPHVVWAVKKAMADGGKNFKLVANLPYQAAGPLIINLLLSEFMPQGMYVTIQAEVAERMAAKEDTEPYGLLSILMQATGTVHILRKLPPQAFWPTPQVTSAMIAWERYPDLARRLVSVHVLKSLSDSMLRWRRKKIRTCLNKSDWAFDWELLASKAEIDPDERGEAISVAKYVRFANLAATALRSNFEV